MHCRIYNYLVFDYITPKRFVENLIQFTLPCLFFICKKSSTFPQLGRSISLYRQTRKTFNFCCRSSLKLFLSPQNSRVLTRRLVETRKNTIFPLRQNAIPHRAKWLTFRHSGKVIEGNFANNKTYECYLFALNPIQPRGGGADLPPSS